MEDQFCHSPTLEAVDTQIAALCHIGSRLQALPAPGNQLQFRRIESSDAETSYNRRKF